MKIQIQHPDIQQARSKSIKIQQVNNPELLMIWIWLQQIAWSGNFFTFQGDHLGEIGRNSEDDFPVAQVEDAKKND